MKGSNYIYMILRPTFAPCQDLRPKDAKWWRTSLWPDWVVAVTLLNMVDCDKSSTKTGTAAEKGTTEAQELAWA